MWPVQPALVAEVLHNPEMDKMKEVYDSIKPVSSLGCSDRCP